MIGQPGATRDGSRAGEFEKRAGDIMRCQAGHQYADIERRVMRHQYVTVDELLELRPQLLHVRGIRNMLRPNTVDRDIARREVVALGLDHPFAMIDDFTALNTHGRKLACAVCSTVGRLKINRHKIHGRYSIAHYFRLQASDFRLQTSNFKLKLQTRLVGQIAIRRSWIT